MNLKKNKDSKIKELITLLKLKKFNPAKEKTLELLKENPNNHVIHNIFGAILTSEDKLEEAILHYKKSIEIKLDYAEAHNNLGTVHQKLNNLEDAFESYKKALKYKSNFAEALSNLGGILHKTGKFEEAISKYNQSLKINPQYTMAYSNLGNTLFELGRFEEAIASHQRAIQIDPNYVDGYSNLGKALTKLGKFEEAIKNYKKAISLNPDFAETYSNLGNTLAELEKFEEAIINHQKSITINPKYKEALFNESVIHLGLGEFEKGWKQYECRFETSSIPPRRYKTKNLWEGSYLDGTLLVWAEQGIGDQILFISMIPDLKKYAKNIIIEIDKRLVDLFKRYCDQANFLNIKIVASKNQKLINNFDKHIAMGSLGQYLRNSEKSFKTTPKRYLISSKLKEQELKEKFFRNKKFNVGICWKTLNKKQQFRNIQLEKMLSILSNTNCNFVNLQFGEFDKDLQYLKQKHGINIQKVTDVDNYNDLDGLAALINCLDLVITIQNSTAHLACALGKKTWIILAKNARWHWLINRKESLWYPSATLFRQKKMGDWNNVINSIGIELKKIINN